VARFKFLIFFASRLVATFGLGFLWLVANRHVMATTKKKEKEEKD